MDNNKLKVLKEIGYSFPDACWRCIHRKFPEGSYWGTCQKYAYEHQKHSDSQRQVSIYRAGCCRDGFEADKGAMLRIGAYYTSLVTAE